MFEIGWEAHPDVRDWSVTNSDVRKWSRDAPKCE